MLYTYEKLKELQALPLIDKVSLTKLRILEWYEHFKGKVCVSYSGGKDSTVLLKLVRELYPEVPAVYVDTRLDYPEVRKHVMDTDNVIVLKPEKNFRAVIDEYGFCYPSKEVAMIIEGARRNVAWAVRKLDGVKRDGTVDYFATKHFSYWKWLVDVDVKLSPKCCLVMKEKPLNNFQKKSRLNPYVGTMASESNRRETSWLKTGCNFYNGREPKSKPLSFWTEQDILRYIVDNEVKIPSVYGSVIADKSGKLKCTGESRTGCVFCPIGTHLNSPNKFQRLKETHKNLYDYCMQQLGLDEFLTKVGVPH